MPTGTSELTWLNEVSMRRLVTAAGCEQGNIESCPPEDVARSVQGSTTNGWYETIGRH